MQLVGVFEVVDGPSDHPKVIVIEANKNDILQCRVAKVPLEPSRHR